MKNYILNKMQALPASFFTASCALVLFMSVFGLQLMMSLSVYADTSMSLSDNIKRVSLINQAVRLPQSLEVMDEQKISILLRNPMLKRKEMDVTAWHYHGNSCSLAVYFSEGQDKPDYIEYRTLSMNADVSAQFEQNDQASINQYCIKDVLEAQGVSTPDSFARQPTPTWDNPYRT
jgi:hypothetical protein